MGLFGNHARLGASNPSGYEVKRSLSFNKDGDANLEFTPSSTGNQKVWTWSGWVKRTELGQTDYLMGCDNDASGNNGIASIYFSTDDKIHTYFDTSGSAPYGAINDTEYRDTSSWYHIVWKVDAANTETKVWVNGVEQTVAGSNMPPDYSYNMNTASKRMNMGTDSWDKSVFSNFYIAEVHYCDGQEYQASDFGETDSDTGAWIPKKVSGITYGTNGFYLDFFDNSAATAAALGKDSSGNGNNWTPNNIVVSGEYNDSTEDTPTNNFPILNWNQTRSATDNRIYDGGLSINWTDAHDNASTVATFGMPSGKWYYEVTNRSDSNAQGAAIIGVCPDSYMAVKICSNTNSWPGFASGSGIGFNGVDQHYTTGSNLGTYGGTWAENDIIGVAVDVDNAKIAMSKNGQWADGSGNYDESSITAGAQKTIPGDAPYFPVFSDTSGSDDPKYTVNFGQRAFSYSIPTGYKKLCSKNLPEPSISASTDYFNTVLYTANGSSQSITSLDFQPDLVWVKKRSGSVASNCLTDSVRGTHKKLNSDNTYAENDQTSVDKGMTAFLSNGFTVKDDAAGNYEQNGQSGHTYVAWCWKESATAGFDIVSYTGNGTNNRNISHSLGVSPDLILLKDRSSNSVSNRWTVFHSYDSSKNLELNTDSGAFSHQSRGSITAVSSSNFTLYGSTDNATVNEDGDNFIAYLFASVSGYSKSGKYNGNGVSDGPFVYTGFKPAWIILKATNGNNWAIFDNKRDPENGMDQRLHPNLTNQTNDGAGETIDFLSNGFKIRTSDSLENPSGSDVVYFAIAERSFKYATAR